MTMTQLRITCTLYYVVFERTRMNCIDWNKCINTTKSDIYFHIFQILWSKYFSETFFFM